MIANKLNPITLAQLIQFNQPTGVLDTVSITKNIKFGSVDWVKKREGIYTPADDFLTLLTAPLTVDQTPNVVMLFVEGGTHVNFISESRLNTHICYDEVVNVYMKLSPDSTSSDRPMQFYLDGRLAKSNPMTQGTPVNYCLILAQAEFA